MLVPSLVKDDFFIRNTTCNTRNATARAPYSEPCYFNTNLTCLQCFLTLKRSPIPVRHKRRSVT